MIRRKQDKVIARTQYFIQALCKHNKVLVFNLCSLSSREKFQKCCNKRLPHLNIYFRNIFGTVWSETFYEMIPAGSSQGEQVHFENGRNPRCGQRHTSDADSCQNELNILIFSGHSIKNSNKACREKCTLIMTRFVALYGKESPCFST